MGLSQNVLLGVLSLVLGPLIFVLCGGAGLFYWWRGRAIQGWPSTSGTVLKSGIHGRSGGSTTYKPKIVYEYSVMGQQFRSENFDLFDLNKGWSGTNRQVAEDRAAQYPEGAQIEVYYDPQRPDHAVLVNRPDHTFALVMVGLGLLMLCLGVSGGLVLLLIPAMLP